MAKKDTKQAKSKDKPKDEGPVKTSKEQEEARQAQLIENRKLAGLPIEGFPNAKLIPNRAKHRRA